MILKTLFIIFMGLFINLNTACQIKIKKATPPSDSDDSDEASSVAPALDSAYAPKNASGTSESDGDIVLAWSAPDSMPSGATIKHYQIDCNDCSPGYSTTTSSTNLTVSKSSVGLVAGTTYSFNIKVVYADTTDYRTSPVTTALATCLDSSTNVNGVNSSGSGPVLNWDPYGTNPDGYKIYRSTTLADLNPVSSESNFLTAVPITVCNATNCSYTDTSAAAGVTYYYRVIPYSDGDGSSGENGVSYVGNTNNISAGQTPIMVGSANPSIPQAPKKLGCKTALYQKSMLQWSAPSGTVTSYKIFRSTSANVDVSDLSAPYDTVASTSWSECSSGCTKTSTIADNTSYYYKVVAVNAEGNSSPSAENWCKTWTKLGGKDWTYLFAMPGGGGTNTGTLNNPYTTLSAAISACNGNGSCTGGSIVVLADNDTADATNDPGGNAYTGSNTETLGSTLTVSKAVTIRSRWGFSDETASNITISGGAYNSFTISSGFLVNIWGFKFTNIANTNSGIYFGDGDNVDNVKILNNYAAASNGGLLTSASGNTGDAARGDDWLLSGNDWTMASGGSTSCISLDDLNRPVIRDNSLASCRSHGLSMIRSDSSSVGWNTISTPQSSGILVSDPSPYALISKNTISGADASASGTNGGIKMDDISSTASVVSYVTGNTISSSGIGVYMSTGTSNGILNNLFVNYNTLSSNSTAGVKSANSNANSNQTINATVNYWGCASGPGGASCSIASGNVTTSSYLTSNPN